MDFSYTESDEMVREAAREFVKNMFCQREIKSLMEIEYLMKS
jgi:hypothetical protein